MEIKGKVFVVTGAGSGLGAASARALVAAGGRVVLADLNREAGEKLAAEFGDNARFVETDVANEASAVNAVNAGKIAASCADKSKIPERIHAARVEAVRAALKESREEQQ